MKYTKRSVVVEATRWFKNGDHPDDDVRTITPVAGDGAPYRSEGRVVRRYRHPGKVGYHQCARCGERLHQHGWIDTREGGHIVCPGDFVVTGVDGEVYPCKPEIFEATYDRVES